MSLVPGRQVVAGSQFVTEISASRRCLRARFSRPYAGGLNKNVSSANQIPTHTSTHPVVSSTILPVWPNDGNADPQRPEAALPDRPPDALRAEQADAVLDPGQVVPVLGEQVGRGQDEHLLGPVEPQLDQLTPLAVHCTTLSHQANGDAWGATG